LSLVNLARFRDLEAEEALARTIDRFMRRFHYIETKLNEAGKSFDRSSLEEMDKLWEEAKRIEVREKTSP
jgi:tetrapyrrole methylase family protein/MazG family protein